LDVLPNRERETLEKWLDELSAEQRRAIKVVNVDMWEPYTLAVKAKLPHATIVADRFHVMKNLNHCLTQARREIQNNASAEVKAQLKGSRWVLVKNQKDLNNKERLKLEAIYQVSPELKTCHELKELFRLLFDTLSEREQAKQALQVWMQQVEALEVKAFKPFLVTLNNWFEQILNYFIERWTNAFAEGINSKVPPPKVVAWSNAPRRCDSTQLAKQMSLLRFSFVFFLVLPFHVLADSFFIQSDGTYTVAS